MKGTAPIEIPSFFTPEWYLQQKDLGKKDMEIADGLYISNALLTKWKRKVGCISGAARKYCGRKHVVSPETVKKLHDQGLTYKAISIKLNIHPRTVQNHMDKFKKLLVDIA